MKLHGFRALDCNSDAAIRDDFLQNTISYSRNSNVLSAYLAISTFQQGKDCLPLF